MKKIQTVKDNVQKYCLGKILPKHDNYGHHYAFTDSGLVVDSVTTILSILRKDHLLKWAITKGVEWLEVSDRWTRLGDPLYRSELLVGAQTAHTDIRDDAGNVGTQAHNAIELYLIEWINTGVKPQDIRLFFPFVTKEEDLWQIPGYVPIRLTAPRKSIKISDELWIVDTDPRAIASARGVEKLFNEHKVVPLYSELLVGDQKYSAGTLDFLCLWDGVLTLVDWKTSNKIDKISYPLQISAYKYFFQHMTGIRIKQCKLIHLSKTSNSFTVWNLVDSVSCWVAFKALCVAYRWMNDRKEHLLKDKKILQINKSLDKDFN